MKTTNDQKKYWEERKIDWDAHYLATWTHPHRGLITAVLRMFPWVSLWEVGCGPGANLKRIVTELQGRQLGGSDVNADAIELAKKTFKGGMFHVEAADDLLLSDGAVDVILSDATLIYTAPKDIDKTLKEMVRATRNNIVLCELHEKSWWKRLRLRWKTGYNAYDYRDKLEKAGCYDIQMFKIPTECWPGTPWEKWGYIITAKIPKK